MKKKIWQTIYSIGVIPLLFILAHIFSIFSKQIREGLYPRRKSTNKLKNWLNENPISGKKVLIHAASLGEFEHIKPVLQRLKEQYGTTNIVTFFSPSGYKNVKSTPGMDFYIYMPFDFRSHWRKIYSLYKPDLLIISKHDVWPAQIWQAKEKQIPAFLVNASLPQNSSRTKPVIKSFLKYVYREFNGIFTISHDDMDRFSIYYPQCRVKVMGDTKYDQVVLRKQAAIKKEMLPKDWIKNKWIFLAGSIWPEDEQHLTQAFKQLLNIHDNIAFIIAPHEPGEKIIDHLSLEFAKWGVCRYSKKSKLKKEKVVIVDTIGDLADLYKDAKAAYVGGSFKQGIHNVMEPAIYGIPVLYGPEHKVSFEAIKLLEAKGSVLVVDQIQVKETLEKLILDQNYCKNLGANALAFAEANTGATNQIIDEWKNLFT